MAKGTSVKADKITLEQLLFEQLGVGKRDVCNDIILSDSCLIELYDSKYFQFIAYNNEGAWVWEGLDLTDKEIPKYIHNPAQWITSKMEEAIRRADEYIKPALIVKYLMWKDLVQKTKASNRVRFRLSVSEDELEKALEEILYEDTTAAILEIAKEEALEEISPNLTPDDKEFWGELEKIEEEKYDELLKEEAIDVCYDLEDKYNTFRDKIRMLCNKLFGK